MPLSIYEMVLLWCLVIHCNRNHVLSWLITLYAVSLCEINSLICSQRTKVSLLSIMPYIWPLAVSQQRDELLL